MPWVEVFVVFFVSHLVGDFALQTEWQAPGVTMMVDQSFHLVALLLLAFLVGD
jgi:hypothetical protein